jgi:hypothetical protein
LVNSSSNKKTSTTTTTPPLTFDIPSELDGIEDIEDGESFNNRRRTIQEITTVPAKRRGSKSNIVKAGLLPPSYYKNPSVSGQVSSEIDELKFKDPFSRKTKERLKQTYTDYTVCSALATLIHYVLGRGAKATVYPVSRDQLKTQEEVDAKLNEVINEFSLAPTSMEDLQNFIDMVDLNCELYERHLQEAMAQAYVFGRSALWIVRANSKIDDPNEGNDMLQKWGFREGVPVSLRPLDSMNLGQVTVDTKSWEPKKIEYVGHLGGVSDVSRQRDELEELDVKDLIYFTRDDYNIIPDSYNYGFARLLDAINVSENKRRLTKRVFAEIDNNQWAGLNIYEIAGMSEKDMQAFATSLKPGRSKVTNQPLKVHNVNPQFDMSGNLAQLKDLTLALLSACKVPSFLMNYEQITNRATTESVLIAWQQTVLEAERNWLRAILWKYWYRQLLEFYFPDKQFLYMKIKILLEFQSIEFASFFERSISVNNLYASRIITVREARELLNLTPFPAEDEDEAVGREQQDLVDKLLKENPDMVEPLKQIDQTKQQADEKIAKIEDPNQLLIGPGTTTKAKSAGQILTRLRSSAKKPSG